MAIRSLITNRIATPSRNLLNNRISQLSDRTLSIRSIDTMKESRDSGEPGQMTQAEIDQHVNLIATYNVTHIVIATVWDNPTVIQKWANSIRSTGKKIWFRIAWNHWQGLNGAPQDWTPTQFRSNSKQFIIDNPTFFQSGDIIDNLEPSGHPYWNATYGANWVGNASADAAFNAFTQNWFTDAAAALSQIGVTGVISNFTSDTAFIALNEYNSTTRSQMYALCIDDYPEGDSIDVDFCVRERIKNINLLSATFPTQNIILSEFGYSNNINVSDIIQSRVLSAEIQAICRNTSVIGMNYWVGAGGPSFGGYTNLFIGAKGEWAASRTAAKLFKSFYGARGFQSRQSIDFN